MDDTNRIRDERIKKLDNLRAEGTNPFANGFTPDAVCAAIHAHAKAEPAPAMDQLGKDARVWSVAGRIMAKNDMGKASFLRLRDRSVGLEEPATEPDPAALPQNLQIYLRKDVAPEADWNLYKSHLDVGDIVGVRGRLFQTRTGEPTLMVDSLVLLTKSLRPLPDKFHGLSDVEMRFRQRYVDLIANATARKIFRTRALIVEHIRSFLVARDYMEVETPMMHVIPGGAAARPFVTHHNALDMPLYLRIAPELYLKRLLVGGFERVFEVNRSFRNEGLSPRHNPEFTMLEFYQAYATYEDLIALTEELMSGLALRLSEAEGRPGDLVRPYGDHQVSWARPFARYTVKESLTAVGGLSDADVATPDSLVAALVARKVELPKHRSYGALLVAAFEGLVEKQLSQPTFITHYPVENSPLARRNEADPTVTDRFELFVAGNEIANAFSELNDPIDQRQRFESQVNARAAGDDEAMFMDLDYVRALEYGMPPAAGQGIGIDRLVMLMTNQQTIREVILFPHMRPEGWHQHLSRPIIILTALGLIALAFFGLLADAEPETVFYAQTATGLFLVIVVVVLVATLVTSLYMRVFGKLADKISSQRFSTFVGWKFLRSQRTGETLWSRAGRSLHALRSRPLTSKLIITGVGLALLLATLIISRPAAWNEVADGVSPSFMTALMLVLTILGSALTLIGVAGLVLPTRAPEPNPQLRQRNAVTLPTFISIIGVAIGLWALIVVLGVIHGLQSDLREKILRTNAHMVVEPQRPDGILGDSVALESAMRALPRVNEADAYVRGEVMMSSPTAIAINVVIKGMIPEALAASEQLRGRVIDGSIRGLARPEELISERPRYPSESRRRMRPQIPTPDETDDNGSADGASGATAGGAGDDNASDKAALKDFDASGSGSSPIGVGSALDSEDIIPSTWGLSQDLFPGILVGAELARQLGIEVGDEVQLISPDGDVGPTGLRPKLASFRVAGVFRTGMYEYDQKLAYTALYAAQRFFDLGRERNALEARMDDADAIDELARAVPLVLDKFPGLVSSSLRERNKNLFSALALERIVMFVILGFIVFVASLLIVSSLVMLVVEKVREIAVLKALGASDSAIVRSFVTIGTFIGLFGVLAGIPLGVGSCVYLIAAGFSLPREFYLSELPVKLDAFEITIFGLAALGMCLIATIYPSRKAAQLKPADGLRHG